MALFSVLTSHSASLDNEAAYRSDIHRENADYRIVWVCKSAPSQQTCIDEAHQAARENEREEQDLAAQKITAWWTKVMGVAALIGMALSAVGVWLVKTTFDETRRANIIAIAQSAHEIGPKITVESVEVKLKGSYFFVDLLIRNLGDGQANSVRAEGCYRVWRDFEERIKIGAKWIKTGSSQSNYFTKEIAPGGSGDVTVFWSGRSKKNRAECMRAMECFTDGNKPGMEFEITVHWDTQFYSGFRARIKFRIEEMTFHEIGDERVGRAELKKGIQYFPESLG